LNVKRKLGFSPEQALGNQLASMEAVLHQAVLDASHVYSVTGREVRVLESACGAIERARSVLDDAICRERPLSDHGVTDAYYPREVVDPHAGESGKGKGMGTG
jgi:hypothetical protein